MKLDINKINSTFNTSFKNIKDFLTFRIEVGGEILRSKFLIPTEEIKIIPLVGQDSFQNQSEVAKLFKHDDEILIALKFHPSITPQEINIDTIKFGITHAQAVIKEGNRVFTINSPQDYMWGGFGNDITYPTIFLKPEGISKNHLKNIKNWLLLINGLTRFPNDYNGGDDINIKTYDDINVYANCLIEAAQGSAEAKNVIESYPVYCAELIYLALNLGMIMPLEVDEVDEVDFQDLLFDNDNPFIHNCSMKEVDVDSFEPHLNLPLFPLTSSEMLGDFIKNADDDLGNREMLHTALSFDRGISSMLNSSLEFFPPHAFLKKYHFEGRADTMRFEYLGHGFDKNFLIE